MRMQPANEIMAQLSEWRRLAGLPAELESGTLSLRERAFCRTVFVDTMCERHGPEPISHRRMAAKDFGNIKNFLEKLRSGDVPEHYLLSFTTAAPNFGSHQVATVSRRFFVTEGGRFGLGLSSLNNTVEVGDEVHVIEGSNLPVILRRVEHQEANNSKYLLSAPLEECNHVHDAEKRVYQCMGFSYVDGIMGGEVVDRRSRFSEVHLR